MRLPLTILLVAAFALSGVLPALAWEPLPVVDDPLPRMPGTQPDEGFVFESPADCDECHTLLVEPDALPPDDRPVPGVLPGQDWRGSMMAQAARDFLFFASLTVANQDSIWALGNPNAADLCVRCHFPTGWVGGRSDPTNASLFEGTDYDGVQCHFCHRLWDPFFEASSEGEREGAGVQNYWDEVQVVAESVDVSDAITYDTPRRQARVTHDADLALTSGILLFNGDPFFVDNEPFSEDYIENGAGQFFVDTSGIRRASFADADRDDHDVLYSRYHKSRFFCDTCHDVSNPSLANLGADPSEPLPTEVNPAFSYFHAERTFSEFQLSDYALGAGSEGAGAFDPDQFNTSSEGNLVSKCQDCHMADARGMGCNEWSDAYWRPGDDPRAPQPTSPQHLQSGVPTHDLTGGNVWVSLVLASTVPGSPIYDPINARLLNQPDVLTLDLSQGVGIDAGLLAEGAARAQQTLSRAADIEEFEYDASTGALSFEIHNNTAHKLLTGYPEGRRMFVNIRAFRDGKLIYEVNPYDEQIGTLKGLPNGDAALDANEVYIDELVYEMHGNSSLTGEEKTFHFALSTGRQKDNRIPPAGFRIGEAVARQAEPVIDGQSALDYFTAEEYEEGADEVEMRIIAGADRVEMNLLYQTTSREYVKFLRDEINGTANTLASPTPSGEDDAYIVQSDPFFSGLKGWGDVVWALWQHNKSLPGAAPIMMANASALVDEPGLVSPILNQLYLRTSGVTLRWSPAHLLDSAITGYKIYRDDGLTFTTGLRTGFIDRSARPGVTYTYWATSTSPTEESAPSNEMTITAGPGPLTSLGELEGQLFYDELNVPLIMAGK